MLHSAIIRLFALSCDCHVPLLFLCRFVTRSQLLSLFFFLMIRRPPRSTLDRASAASDVYKRQMRGTPADLSLNTVVASKKLLEAVADTRRAVRLVPVSYTHLRAHETVLDLVCRLLLEKKKHISDTISSYSKRGTSDNTQRYR